MDAADSNVIDESQKNVSVSIYILGFYLIVTMCTS